MSDPVADGAGKVPAPAPSPPPALIVVSPDGEDLGPVSLATKPIRIGREPDNDVILHPDPAQVISREHCVVERVGRRWWVRDLDSRNHTYLERQGERAQVDHVELVDGDAVCIQADSAEDAITGKVRCWRVAFTDPGGTRGTSETRWLQYFSASETVWVHGGGRLARRVDARGKARRMLFFLLARYRERDEPRDGVFASHAELRAVLWPEDGDAQTRSDGDVANVAWGLREALDDEDQKLLQTEIGAGYRLVPRP